jgi:hypothetical protein
VTDGAEEIIIEVTDDLPFVIPKGINGSHANNNL